MKRRVLAWRGLEGNGWRHTKLCCLHGKLSVIMLVSAEDWQFGVALHQIPMHHGNGWRIAVFVVARIGSYRRVDPKIPLGIGPIDIILWQSRVVMICLILIPLAAYGFIVLCLLFGSCSHAVNSSLLRYQLQRLSKNLSKELQRARKVLRNLLQLHEIEWHEEHQWMTSDNYTNGADYSAMTSTCIRFDSKQVHFRILW